MLSVSAARAGPEVALEPNCVWRFTSHWPDSNHWQKLQASSRCPMQSAIRCALLRLWARKSATARESSPSPAASSARSTPRPPAPIALLLVPAVPAAAAAPPARDAPRWRIAFLTLGLVALASLAAGAPVAPRVVRLVVDRRGVDHSLDRSELVASGLRDGFGFFP